MNRFNPTSRTALGILTAAALVASLSADARRVATLPDVGAAGITSPIAAPPDVDPEANGPDLGPDLGSVPAVPATPLGAIDVLLVRPFTLVQPYEDDWRLERPLVRGGVLMVVDLPPDAAYPRQVAEPVLLVGARVAERLHVAWPRGRAVIIVPTEVTDSGEVTLDLAKEPVFFGTPELPERVDAAWLDAEVLAAAAAEIRPFPAARIAEARRRGGATQTYANRNALLGAAALLIREFVPEQDEVAETLLMNAVAE